MEFLYCIKILNKLINLLEFSKLIFKIIFIKIYKFVLTFTIIFFIIILRNI